MLKVVDNLGLVEENNFLTVYLPILKKALIFRIVARRNKGFEVLNYGSLPLTKEEVLASYVSGTQTVPEDGVFPPMSYTADGHRFPSPFPNVYEESDMWFLPKEENTTLFHVYQYLTPSWIRIDVQIPIYINQIRFQGDRVVGGVDKDWGFKRGILEMIHFPGIKIGYRWGNDTNLTVYTNVKFIFAEYVVEIPKDPELIFNILVKKVPSHWVSLPVLSNAEDISRELIDVYGIDGFPLYPITEKDKAISEYKTILKGVTI